jgi:hypothetical protein
MALEAVLVVVVVMMVLSIMMMLPTAMVQTIGVKGAKGRLPVAGHFPT